MRALRSLFVVMLALWALARAAPAAVSPIEGAVVADAAAAGLGGSGTSSGGSSSGSTTIEIETEGPGPMESAGGEQQEQQRQDQVDSTQGAAAAEAQHFDPEHRGLGAKFGGGGKGNDTVVVMGRVAPSIHPFWPTKTSPP
jgi:hypothetical protein